MVFQTEKERVKELERVINEIYDILGKPDPPIPSRLPDWVRKLKDFKDKVEIITGKIDDSVLIDESLNGVKKYITAIKSIKELIE
jgi:hypothetical protein